MGNAMEDLSSFEISRAQIWQWKRHNVVLNTASHVDENLINHFVSQELEEIHLELQSSLSDPSELVLQEDFLKKSASILKDILFKDELDSYFTDIVEKYL